MTEQEIVEQLERLHAVRNILSQDMKQIIADGGDRSTARQALCKAMWKEMDLLELMLRDAWNRKDIGGLYRQMSFGLCDGSIVTWQDEKGLIKLIRSLPRYDSIELWHATMSTGDIELIKRVHKHVCDVILKHLDSGVGVAL